MRILIESIMNPARDTTLVTFKCQSGSGKGRWAPYARLPLLGMIYNVELNLNNPIALGETTIKSSSTPPHITVALDKTIIHVSIEGKDEDGVLYGRLAQDCIIMLEQGDDEIDTGDFISITVPSAEILISPF